MKIQRLKWGLAVLALSLLAAAAGYGYVAPPRAQTAPPLTASGVIQAEQIALASELGGRIAAIPVEEGDVVAAGVVVVQLDTAVVDAQIEVARAMVALAEAGLAQARAGARPGKLAVAEAQLAQAQAGYLATQQAISDTDLLLAHPQDIDLQIAVTRAQLEAAEHQLAQAVALKDAVELGKAKVDEVYEQFDGGGRHRFNVGSGSLDDLVDKALPPDLVDQLPPLPDLPEIPDGEYKMGDWELTVQDGQYSLFKWAHVVFPLEATTMPNVWWQAWIGVNAAGAKKDGLDAKLAQLYRQRSHPQEMQARADEVRSMAAQVAAQIMMAQAQVDGLESGATPEKLATIEARVAQARAGLNSLLRQREMLSLTTPLTGTVVDVLAYEGEVAAQGAALLHIANLDDMTLTVYVPQNHLGQVALDQPVAITINSFPGHEFAGKVSRISDSAEFTPRNVATAEERVNLVFAVEIRVLNSEQLLKPGMPADVVFAAQEE